MGGGSREGELKGMDGVMRGGYVKEWEMVREEELGEELGGKVKEEKGGEEKKDKGVRKGRGVEEKMVERVMEGGGEMKEEDVMRMVWEG